MIRVIHVVIIFSQGIFIGRMLCTCALPTFQIPKNLVAYFILTCMPYWYFLVWLIFCFQFESKLCSALLIPFSFQKINFKCVCTIIY